MNSSNNPRSCAIVQLEAVHEEIIPSLILALNQSGLKPTVYVNDRCRANRGDVFAGMTRLDFELVYVSLHKPADWLSLASRIKSPPLNEFVVMATFQLGGVAKWANKLGLPLVGVVHNPKLFMASSNCIETLESGKSGLICLAPHVAVFLHQRLPRQFIDRVAVVESVYWGEPDKACGSPREIGSRIVAIPGGVNFTSRGFEELIEALSSGQTSASKAKLVFSVLGGGPDRARLEALVGDKGVEESFHFAPVGAKGMVMYPDYIEALRRATLVHPLAPLSFSPYREHKITSAIPTAVGFCLPIILDRWTERTYRLPCIVSDASVRASVDLLARLEDSEITTQSKAVSHYRDKTIERNASEIARLIRQIQ